VFVVSLNACTDKFQAVACWTACPGHGVAKRALGQPGYIAPSAADALPYWIASAAVCAEYYLVVVSAVDCAAWPGPAPEDGVIAFPSVLTDASFAYPCYFVLNYWAGRLGHVFSDAAVVASAVCPAHPVAGGMTALFQYQFADTATVGATVFSILFVADCVD
jgi:hypothetical protein